MASLLNRPFMLAALLPFLATVSVSNIALAQDGFAAVPSSRHDSSQYGISKTKSKSSANLPGKERTRPSLVELKNSSVSTAVFIENMGQFDPKVRFQVKIGAQIAWLTTEGIVFDAVRPTRDQTLATSSETFGGFSDRLSLLSPQSTLKATKAVSQVFDRLVFSEDFVKASCCSKMESKDPLPGVYNYLQSSDPTKWRTNIQGYSEVVYRDIWQGVDLRIHGNGPDLEQEFIIRPGSDLSLVEIAYQGIEKINVAGDGSLEIHTGFGQLRETRPLIYQEIAGKRESVSGRFSLRTSTSYGFQVDSYKPQYALVVDPTLLYSTFLGGPLPGSSGTSNTSANGIAVDGSGNAYVAGNTASADFPTTPGAFQVSYPGVEFSGFITKLNATGSALVYSTYLGQNFVQISAIAVDASGQAYVTGFVTNGFPTTQNAYSRSCSYQDFIVAVLSATGDKLVYATCLGVGSDTGGGAIYGASPKAIAVDSRGRVYIGGSADGHIPTTPNAFQPSFPGAGPSAFVMGFDITASGSSSLLYSSYFGGSAGSGVNAIAVDAFGDVYVAGFANDGFPTTPGAFQTAHKGTNSCFVPCDTNVCAQPSCHDAFIHPQPH